MNSISRVIGAVLVAAIGTGCSSYPKDLPCFVLFLRPLSIPGYAFEPTSDCVPPCRILAGAAKVDITPPAGFPMGGSGPAGQFGRGYWTRLSARAFFFRDVRGQSLAVVSCDLAAVSAGLQMEVASRLYQSGLKLTRENLILAATHVHHGPGNFMTYKLYNDQGSPAAGWDKTLFQWLAERITCAIREAKENAESVPITMKTELVLREGEVVDLLRNRAPEFFMLNTDRDDVLSQVPKPLNCPEPDSVDCPRWRAVDNRLAVLEIRRTPPGGPSKTAGSLVFLSVHPEAMSHLTELYQSDFTGLAMSELEKRDGRVAAFFNGADGDISVRWKRQDRREALDFSVCLLQAIDGSTETAAESEVEVGVAREELIANPYFVKSLASIGQFPRTCVQNPADPKQRPCLAGEPMFGVATAGGAEDARTPLYDLGWKPGVRGIPAGDQGVKMPPFRLRVGKLDVTRLVAASCDYPERIPLSLVRLRGQSSILSFAVLPAELTRTAWRRIETHLPSSLGRVLPLGLANEYVSYVTTREEYGGQGYEGASDTFGPMTGEVFQVELLKLADELHAPRSVVESADFYPGKPLSKTESFGPESVGFRHPDADEALEPLIVDEMARPERHWPRFEWREKGIGDWKAADRDVRILSGSSTVDDDKGPNILTVFVSPPSPQNGKTRASHSLRTQSYGSPIVHRLSKAPVERCWMAIWLAPHGTNVNESFVFSVTRADGTLVRSDAFTLTTTMSQDPPKPVPPESRCYNPRPDSP
jgi:neutral ceramidase